MYIYPDHHLHHLGNEALMPRASNRYTNVMSPNQSPSFLRETMERRRGEKRRGKIRGKKEKRKKRRKNKKRKEEGKKSLLRVLGHHQSLRSL